MDFFAKEALSLNERVICVYHGKIIPKKYAYVKTQLFQYIVEVTNHYKLPLCIDRLDDTRQQFFNKGCYANDAIAWDGTRGKWNAEFIIHDYDGRKIILKHLRDIAKGEHIFAWYGPHVWCDARH